MTDSDILAITKTNLQISVTAYDTLLTNYITSAKTYIGCEGITLDTSVVGDCILVSMYASYLYKSGKGELDAMPRALRYALNNRLLAEKGDVT